MNVRVDELWAPMRDGVRLFSKVFRPAHITSPLPAVMMRSPYNSGIGPPIWDGLCEALAQEGYAVINQDVRGTCRSEGAFHPFFQEAADGYDAVEWAASQVWCNGKIGLWGMSYLGACALQAAVERPPHLVAVAAHFTACDYFDHWVYDNGVFNSLFIEEWVDGFARDARWRSSRGIGVDGLATERPGFYREWVAHPYYDDYWAAIDLTLRCRNLDIPLLLKGGWFDVFATGTLATFVHTSEAADETVRGKSRLRMAPVCHGPWNSTTLRFPLAASAMPDMDPLWWNHWLKDHPLSGELKPAVRLYVMAPPLQGEVDEGFWIECATWPIAESRPRQLALASDGWANGAEGNGRLLWDGVSAGSPDQFIHHPDTPLPTLGGALCTLDPNIPVGVVDQAPLARREDVLIYKTGPLANGLAAIGPVKVVFWACSSATHTQYSVKLTVARPDGTVLNFLDRMVHSTLRDGSHGPVQSTRPHVPYRYEIELGHVALSLRPGMCLRIEIASSNYPRFDAGTRHDSQAPHADPHVQTVLHDAEHPSWLELSEVDVERLVQCA